jgi:tetratricopeptide (TPR) repeat protein
VCHDNDVLGAEPDMHVTTSIGALRNARASTAGPRKATCQMMRQCKLCRVLAVAPQDTQALSSRGYCMRKLHRIEEAVADYSRAIDTSPPSLRLFNNRAYCLAKLGRYRAAVDDYSAVLHLDPANLHALQNRCAHAILFLIAAVLSWSCHAELVACQPLLLCGDLKLFKPV